MSWQFMDIHKRLFNFITRILFHFSILLLIQAISVNNNIVSCSYILNNNNKIIFLKINGEEDFSQDTFYVYELRCPFPT